MYYNYDTDENYYEPYSYIPFYPMMDDDMMDYGMTRQRPEYYSPQRPRPQRCGPNGRWVPGHWERRWVPGHCEYRRPR